MVKFVFLVFVIVVVNKVFFLLEGSKLVFYLDVRELYYFFTRIMGYLFIFIFRIIDFWFWRKKRFWNERIL